MNTELICRAACVIAKEAGAFIRKERTTFKKSSVEYKSPHDLVSYVDKTAEKMLVGKLQALVPGCGFITEEDKTLIPSEEYNWVIDPLDGTTNFIHGIPCYCVSLALMHKGVTIIGVVYEINFDECFYAWENSPAYMNDQKIQVSSTSAMSESLLATGFPSIDYSRLKEFMNVFDYTMKETRGLRRLGSAAADLVYVACGRLDGFFEYSLNSWDVAGGAFIVQRAGGKVSDFSGGENYIFGKEIVATNQLIFAEFSGIITKCFTS